MNVTSLFSEALRHNASYGFLILDVSRSHTTTQHSRQDFSGRAISLSQRPGNTTLTTDKHPCPQRNSNTQS